MIKHKAFASTRVIALMLGAALIASGKAKADFVIADDLIVQGSACVGLDCVDGEAFGFDTIRLKENNTRIKFDDTSTSPGFPANDWQLTIKDSALISVTGGAELMLTANKAARSTHHSLLFYTVAGILYLVMTSISTPIFDKAERYTSRSFLRPK